MSFSFYIKGVKTLPLPETIDNMGLPNVQFQDENVLKFANRWPRKVSKLYQNNVSIRFTEVKYENEQFKARIFSGVSVDDYLLCLALVESVAKVANKPIQAEDNETPLHLDEFKKTYNEEWAKWHCYANLETLIQTYHEYTTNNENSSIELEGVFRKITIGKRVVSLYESDRESGPQSVFENNRLSNYISLKGAVEPSIVEISNPDDGDTMRISSYSEDLACLLSSDINQVFLSSGGPFSNREKHRERSIKTTFDEFVRALGRRGVWLTDEVYYAPAIVGDEFDELIDTLSE